MAKQADYPRPVQQAIDYAARVVDGEIPAGKWVRLACKRFRRDMREAQRRDGQWYFDPQRAIRPIIFAGYMRNIKGPEAGLPISLMDWQNWLICNLYGFVDRPTGIRRFRQASVWVPRGNGKSSLAAVLALNSTFVEGEGGAEGYTAAVTRDQARIVFDLCNAMTTRSPEFRRQFGVQSKANSIYQTSTASKLMPVSSDAKALDGLNVHFAVLDEIGSHRSKAVYDVILTAMGKRTQPLLISISTATDNVTGVGKQVWDYSEKVLEGLFTDNQLFAVMYAADLEDDVWAETTWRKANPGWGQMVQPAAIASTARQAQASPALKAAFMTRHLNIWVQADFAVFDVALWDQCAQPQMQLSEFMGQPCFVAIDMAVRVDLAAGTVMFPYHDEATDQIRYAIFHRAWLPRTAVDPNRNPAYVGWVEDGWITVTEGETTDYSEIEDWVRLIARDHDMRAMVYDPHKLQQFAQRLGNEGFPVLEYRPSTLNFSEPTQTLDQLIRDRRIDHDASPVARWCIGNVVGHFDKRDNIYPNKARNEAKIDCAICDIMAIGGAIASDADQQTIYADGRDLLVF